MLTIYLRIESPDLASVQRWIKGGKQRVGSNEEAKAGFDGKVPEMK